MDIAHRGSDVAVVHRPLDKVDVLADDVQAGAEGVPHVVPPGSIVAPDDEAAARAKAIEYFRIEPAHHFRVVVTKVGRVKTKETA